MVKILKMATTKLLHCLFSRKRIQSIKCLQDFYFEGFIFSISSSVNLKKGKHTCIYLGYEAYTDKK